MRAWLLLALIASATRVHGASTDEEHYHQGLMKPYEIGPPSVQLSKDDEAALEAGQTLMQATVQSDGGSRRLLMVKDIKTPKHIIFGRILDLEAYPRMVKGVDALKTYDDKTDKKGVRTIKAKYQIHAMHLKFTCASASPSFFSFPSSCLSRPLMFTSLSIAHRGCLLSSLVRLASQTLCRTSTIQRRAA